MRASQRLVLAALLCLLLCIGGVGVSHAQDPETAALVSEEITVTLTDAATSSSASASASSPASPPPLAASSSRKKPSRKLSDFEANTDAALPASAPKRAVTTSLPPTPPADPSASLSWGLLMPLSSPSAYLLELLGLLLVAAYGVTYYLGVKRNDELAVQYFARLVPLLSSQFSSTAAYDAPTLHSGCCLPLPGYPAVRLYRDSAWQYQLHCSGRRNCGGFLLTLELVKRFDLFSLLLRFLDLAQSRDQLTVDCNVDRMQPMVIAAVVKKYQMRMKKNVKDLKLFTDVIRPQSLSALPASLSLMADSAEAAELVLEGEPLRLLSLHHQLLILLHISDQAIPSHLAGSSKRVLHCKMYLPALSARGGGADGVVELLRLCCVLVDRVGSVVLSARGYEKALELRRKAEELAAKEAEKEREKDRPEKEKVDKPMSKKKEAKLKKPKIKLMRQ